MYTLPTEEIDGREIFVSFHSIKLIEIFILLVYFSYEDIRFRKISTYLLLAGAVTAIIFLVWGREYSVGEYLAGGCLGVIFFLLGLVSENIGTGDGALIMQVGLMLGIRKLVSILFVSLMLCAAGAVVLCIAGKAKRESRLPFVPFLFGGFCVTVLAGG